MDEIRGRRAMLCFPQMATKAQITAEQYLHMTFEHDAEYVHGEIVERSMPDNIHSLIQFLILMEIGRLIRTHPLFPRPELRLRLEPRVFRIPDISVFGGQAPRESVPSTPPLLVIEILSKDDRHLQPHGETRGVSRLGRSEHLGGRSAVQAALASTPNPDFSMRPSLRLAGLSA